VHNPLSGIKVLETKVGDRYVLEECLQCGSTFGGEQSGHIEAIGFEMYMKLLEQAVREPKGQGGESEARELLVPRGPGRIGAAVPSVRPGFSRSAMASARARPRGRYRP